jgi:hypothetical protein
MKQEREKLPGEKLQTAVIFPAIAGAAGAVGGAKVGGAIAGRLGASAAGRTLATRAGEGAGEALAIRATTPKQEEASFGPTKMHLGNTVEFQDSYKKYVKKEWLENKNRFRYIYPEDLNNTSRKIQREFLKGGKADGKADSNYDDIQLNKGIKHEKEHTTNKNIAKEITKDHLEEDPKYYDKIKKIETQDEGGPRGAWKWDEHKYAARTGSKGNYKYVYKDQGKNIKDDLKDEEKQGLRDEDKRWVPGQTPQEQNERARHASKYGGPRSTGYEIDPTSIHHQEKAFGPKAPSQRLPPQGKFNAPDGYTHDRGLEISYDVIGEDNPNIQNSGADPLAQVADEGAYEQAKNKVLYQHQMLGGKIYARENHYILLAPDNTIMDPAIGVAGVPKVLYEKSVPYQFQRIK